MKMTFVKPFYVPTILQTGLDPKFNTPTQCKTYMKFEYDAGEVPNPQDWTVLVPHGAVINHAAAQATGYLPDAVRDDYGNVSAFKYIGGAKSGQLPMGAQIVDFETGETHGGQFDAVAFKAGTTQVIGRSTVPVTVGEWPYPSAITPGKPMAMGG